MNKNTIDLRERQDNGRQFPNVRIYRLYESAALGDCLNYAAERVRYDIIAKMDDDDYNA